MNTRPGDDADNQVRWHRQRLLEILNADFLELFHGASAAYEHVRLSPGERRLSAAELQSPIRCIPSSRRPLTDSPRPCGRTDARGRIARSTQGWQLRLRPQWWATPIQARTAARGTEPRCREAPVVPSQPVCRRYGDLGVLQAAGCSQWRMAFRLLGRVGDLAARPSRQKRVMQRTTQRPGACCHTVPWWKPSGVTGAKHRPCHSLSDAPPSNARRLAFVGSDRVAPAEGVLDRRPWPTDLSRPLGWARAPSVSRSSGRSR